MTALGRVFADPSRSEEGKYCVCECEFVVQMTVYVRMPYYLEMTGFSTFLNIEMPFIYGYTAHNIIVDGGILHS